MTIISDDNFFILGIHSIFQNSHTEEPPELIIFDTGGTYVYLFDSSELNKEEMEDSFSAFIYCQKFFHRRDIIINDFRYLLRPRRKLCDPTSPHQTLTKSELWIIKAISQELSTRYIANHFNISEKTISSHKISALKKLSIKNVGIFNSALSAWNAHWPELARLKKSRELMIRDNEYQELVFKIA